MQDEKTFVQMLTRYRGVDLSEFITFLTAFRTSLNQLTPSDIIPMVSSAEETVHRMLAELVPEVQECELPHFQMYCLLEPSDLYESTLESAAERGHGAYVDAVWTDIMKPQLYRLVLKAWQYNGPQSLSAWTKVAQMTLDACYGQTWPTSVFQEPAACPICLQTMHWAKTTTCGHVFHLKCLMQHMRVNQNTCPLCRHENPLWDS